MHKNSTALTACFVALVFAVGAGSALAAEEEVGGGAEATAADMAKICEDQAATLNLSGDDKTEYLSKCNKTSIQSVQRSARKMEGKK